MRAAEVLLRLASRSPPHGKAQTASEASKGAGGFHAAGRHPGMASVFGRGYNPQRPDSFPHERG